MLGYLLLTLLPVAAAIYIVWSYRKRTAERAAASSKRFAEMFGATDPGKPAGSSSAPATAGAAAPLCLKKDKVPEGQHAMLFRALSAGLGGYLVFPHVSLAAIVQLPSAVQGREREQRLRALAQNVVDCLVCDPDAHPIAAIDLENGARAEAHIKSQYLAAARLRYLRIDAAALPGPQEMRNIVLAAGESKSS